jgi:hypothetical protein
MAGPARAVGLSVSYPVTEVVTIGVERFWPLAVLPVADESGGTYFSAAETDRLRLLFGGGSREFEGENLTVGTRNTFITAGVELTASPGQANRVAVKPGADY